MTFSMTAGDGLPRATAGSRAGFRERLTSLPRYIKNVRPPKAALLASLALALLACRPPLHVDTLQLGSKLNGDNTIATHTTRFKPDDRIFAAVLTDATGSSTITVHWNYNGMMVSEESRKVAYKGAGATAFEFKSASGFPVGDYKVDILVDDQSVASREFRVE
jgi:hypothetical protein